MKIVKENFILTAEYITLGQFLKEINVISSGGMAKWFLQENVVYVDGEVENRRGRKLYAEMMIEVPEVGTFFMVSSNDSNRDE